MSSLCVCLAVFVSFVNYLYYCDCLIFVRIFFFQAEDGIRYLVRSRGLGDVYKRQFLTLSVFDIEAGEGLRLLDFEPTIPYLAQFLPYFCLLYTSDAADERSSVDLGGRRIIKKKNTEKFTGYTTTNKQ